MDAVAVEERVLPAVFKPGLQQGPDGPEEVSNADFAEAVLEHIGDDSNLYRLGEVLGLIEGDPGARRFRPLDPDGARLVVDRAVRITSTRLVKAEGGGQVLQESYHPCTRDLAGVFLAHARAAPTVRTLRSIVSHPVYLPGFDLAKPGFNAKGGVFYDAPEHLAAVVPDARPTPQILETLDLLVEDFPFKDEASRENFHALLLTRVLRPAIEGPTPFFFVMASQERTGKGKLLDVGSIAVTGEKIPVMQIGTEEDEREKRITSLMLRGSQAVHFDNVPTGVDLDSAAIASLATAYPTWTGRVLGGSTMPALPNSLVVAFSGNNPRASGENAKRSVPIVLEDKTGHPETRENFLHPDCYAWALEQRPAVLAALCGLVEAWKAAKRPTANRRLGGFERWIGAVGGALHHAGASHFLGNYEPWVRGSNDFGADAEMLVAELDRRFPKGEHFQAKDAYQIANDLGVFNAYYGGKNDTARLTSFSMKVMRALVDRTVNGVCMRRLGSGSSSFYAIENLVLFA